MYACLGLSVAVGGCYSTPKALPPPEIRVGPQFVKNPQPPASLRVPGYAKVYDDSERGRAAAMQLAALEATYLAKMAAQVRGLRFTRIDEILGYEDKRKALNFSIGQPEIAGGEAVAIAEVARPADVTAEMAELDLVQVDVSLSHPTAERMSEAIQAALWQGIRKFVVEKHALDIKKSLRGDLTLVDLTLQEDSQTRRFTMQLNVHFPKSKPRLGHKIPAVKTRKRTVPRRDLPPQMRKLLR